MNVLIAIKACEKHLDRAQKQLSTWAQHHVMPFTGIFLGVPDDYESLPLKTQAICRFCLKAGYDHIFLPDTDTYVALDRLMQSGFEDYDYVGRENAEHPGTAYGGPGYWLSRKSMSILADAPCGPGFEDQWAGDTLLASGVKFHHDSRYAIYQRCLAGNDIISQHLTGNGPYSQEMMLEAHKIYTRDFS